MHARRSTIGKNSSSLKQRQISHLNSQLGDLQTNLIDFENLIKMTAFQAEYIKKLGIMHGSLFMASHKIFEEEVRVQENSNQEPPQQQEVQQNDEDHDMDSSIIEE